MKTVTHLLACIALIAMGIYIILFIPTVADFSKITVELEGGNTKIWQFLIYLPIIISIFNGLLTGANIFAKNTALSIMNIIVAIATAVYIFIDVMGALTIFDAIHSKLVILAYINIAGAVLMIAGLIVSYILTKKKQKQIQVA